MSAADARLRARRAEVARLAAEGLTNTQIAARVGVSRDTVRRDRGAAQQDRAHDGARGDARRAPDAQQATAPDAHTAPSAGVQLPGARPEAIALTRAAQSAAQLPPGDARTARDELPYLLLALRHAAELVAEQVRGDLTPFDAHIAARELAAAAHLLGDAHAHLGDRTVRAATETAA